MKTLKRIKPRKTDDIVLALKEAKRFHSLPGRTVLDGCHLYEDEKGDVLRADDMPNVGLCRACVYGAALAMVEDVVRADVSDMLRQAATRLGFNLLSMTDLRTDRRLTPQQIAQVYDLAIEIVEGRRER